MPLVAIIALVWLMVGCVYVPWFEQAKLTGTGRDFRGLAVASDGFPVADGHATRDGVARLLGPPRLRSYNGRVWVYTLTTRHGVWVEPLCSQVTAGGQHVDAPGLRFDADGVLEHHRLVEKGIDPQVGSSDLFYSGPDGPEGTALASALADIDHDSGVVVPNRFPPRGGRPSPGVRLGFAVGRRY